MTTDIALRQEWPRLRVDDWTETRDTLHMWTQIVGKVRLTQAPMLNHWWQVTLYVTPRGLSTGTIPHRGGLFDLELDFVEHHLRLRSSDGGERLVGLSSRPVADFYHETMAALGGLGIEATIDTKPNEVDPAIPFAQDHQHSTYDPHAAHLFWRQLVHADRAMGEFRSHFVGKVSPVHFFWGAMDLACTRFSGRAAPEHPGGAPNCGDWVMVEGYSRRAEQRRVLAGRRRGRGVLRLRLPRARRLRPSPRTTGGRVLQRGEQAVPAAVRSSCRGREPRSRPAGLPALHLSGRR